VEDEFTKEGLAIEVDGRIRSGRVIEVLSRLVSERGAPRHLRSDNGPEFVARAVLQWAVDQGIETAPIDPGKPWQNGVAESFMYGRPLRCKVGDEVWVTSGSGAFMYAACSCGPSHDRWP
jgi:transposase InsO family protein